MKSVALKLMFCVSAALCALCLGLVGLNLYDYVFSDVLPWREGDLGRVLMWCLGAASVFGFLALYLYRSIRQS